MTAGNWQRAVREQVGLGRLLPLGAAADGTWIAERAAAGVLRRAAAGVPGARVTGLRVELAADAADAGGGTESAGGAEGAGPGGGGEGGDTARPGPRPDPVHDGGGAGAEVRYLDERTRAGAEAHRRRAAGPAPLSALPYGELRIAAECDAAVDRPMTATAEALREALLQGAQERLGLRVAAVDIHVAGLLETPQAAAQPAAGAPPGSPPAAREKPHPGHGAPDVPGLLDVDVLPGGDHAEVRVVLDSAHRALDVALAVRARTDAATVTVLVTDIR
ncbi:hypothetical protein [Streptomyces sp. B5E4]|uniref:hypothetical protein n=1 Tax=Streptomyces sp. B5E4 TaxID=3153568 RepID=UPI00325C3845